MTLETFKGIVQKFGGRLKKRAEPLLLAGGEPTLHPQLFEFIKIARDAGVKTNVRTNGKLVTESLKLCAMAKRGELMVLLSLNRWKEKIDPQVIKAFLTNPRLRQSPHDRRREEGTYLQNMNDPQDKRRVTICKIPILWGRAKTNNVEGAIAPRRCPYGNFQVKWDGTFCVCGGKWGGCEKHKFNDNILDDAAVEKYLPVFEETQIDF
jgi:hypothetical protein